MSNVTRPILVIEDDPFPPLLQTFLDASEDAERSAGIADFIAHDIPDYGDWLEGARANAAGLYPAEVRLVSSQEDLRAALPGADAVVTESLLVGPQELRHADRLRVVPKYGTVLRNIDTALCAERGIEVLTVRRRANIACAEYAFGLMLALAKKLLRTANRIGIDQLRAAGFAPKPLRFPVRDCRFPSDLTTSPKSIPPLANRWASGRYRAVVSHRA